MRLFTPIVKLLKSLNEAKKFSFIGVILGIPMIVLTLIFVIVLNNDIKTTEKRYHGTHYNYLMKQLLKHTEQYRMHAMLSFRNPTDNQETLEPLSENVQKQMNLIDEYERDLTNSTHISSFLEQLEKRWEYVVISGNLAELSRTYNHFQSYLNEQLEYIAIEYNMNLAKDKYIYNLTNTVVKIMPRLIGQLNQVQMICQKSYPYISDEENRQVIYSTSSIQNLLRELERGRKAMLAADTSYPKHISYQDPPIVDEIADFIYYVEYEFDAKTEQVEHLIDRASDAIQVSFEYYDRELNHLDKTLNAQLKQMKLFRFIIMSFQLIAFILTVYSFIGFYIAIRQSLKQINEEKEVAKDKYREVQQKLIHVEQQLSRQVMQAHEEERKRIARDLHDSIGQALYSVLVKLKVAKTTNDSEKNLRDITKIVETLMEDVRRISHVLRPDVLDDLGFIQALKSFINHYQKIYAIKVYFTCTDEDIRLNSNVETQLYRICQEALTNVAKHAKATIVHVTLEISEEKLNLTIQDNGRGFDVKQHFNEQFRQEIGLYSMKERAELLGGTFKIVSKINEGTIIHVNIPKDE